MVLIANAPPIPGLGATGGFKFEIQDLNDQGVEDLAKAVENFIAEARKRPELTAVYTTFNPATDSVPVRGIIPNNQPPQIGDYDLIPGQYVPVRLTVGEDADALLIPQPALVESQIGKQVFVVTADNKVEVRNVEAGRSYENQWIIKKGLKKAEKVIVEGTQKVRPGVVVNPKTYTDRKASSG